VRAILFCGSRDCSCGFNGLCHVKYVLLQQMEVLCVRGGCLCCAARPDLGNTLEILKATGRFKICRPYSEQRSYGSMISDKVITHRSVIYQLYYETFVLPSVTGHKNCTSSTSICRIDQSTCCHLSLAICAAGAAISP
jgi:hypothetical protein